VIGGGVAGLALAGPAGAIVGGVSGGAAMDAIITGADSAVNREFKPHGYIAAWNDGINGTSDMERTEGLINATTILPVFDALGGRGATKLPQQYQSGGPVAVLKPTLKPRRVQANQPNSFDLIEKKVHDAIEKSLDSSKP
jgi:hypothetical protein